MINYYSNRLTFNSCQPSENFYRMSDLNLSSSFDPNDPEAWVDWSHAETHTLIFVKSAKSPQAILDFYSSLPDGNLLKEAIGSVVQPSNSLQQDSLDFPQDNIYSQAIAPPFAALFIDGQNGDLMSFSNNKIDVSSFLAIIVFKINFIEGISQTLYVPSVCRILCE